MAEQRLNPRSQASAEPGGRLLKRRHALRLLVAGLGCFLALAGRQTAAQGTAPTEYQVKAAFIYNFAKFIEWPSNAFTTATTPFTIGIVGENPIAEDLAAVIQDKTLNGRPFAYKQVKNPADMASCHILFISGSERRRLGEILGALKDRSILTVSEVDRFTQFGGMINFVVEDKKVRFEINTAEARQVGLKISSKLLSLAKKREDES